MAHLSNHASAYVCTGVSDTKARARGITAQHAYGRRRSARSEGREGEMRSPSFRVDHLCGPRAIGTCTDYWVRAGSRYIYDLYYEKEAISRQLYDWLLKNAYADASLIAKWKKQGYEKVDRSQCPKPLTLQIADAEL